MVYGTLGFGRLKIDDVSWITAAVALYVPRGKISIASSELIFANSLVVGFTFAHLRIVSRLRLKGEADGAAEKAHGEGVAAGIKAQTEAYNGMENAYLLANRYIDVMPEVAEAVAKPLTAVDSIKMYGDGNATKLVRDTTGMVDQVTSGLKDATGIDLTELLSSFHQPFQPREDNE